MKNLSLGILFILVFSFAACDKDSDSNPDPIENRTNEEKATELLISLETGDTSKAMKYVDPNQYIQHNHQMEDGRQALVDAILNGDFDNYEIDISRSFSEDNLVVLHSEYTIGGESRIAFDVFRFANGLIVEHWDNFQDNQPVNPSGRTMIHGPVSITNLDQTDANITVANEFITTVMIGGNYPLTAEFLKDDENLIQHNPMMADNLSGMLAMMDTLAAQNIAFEYETLHQTVGMGNFVLTMSEGVFGNPAEPTAFYDLFRLEDGKIVEHWDVIETIAPQGEWVNQNGKF